MEHRGRDRVGRKSYLTLPPDAIRVSIEHLGETNGGSLSKLKCLRDARNDDRCCIACILHRALLHFALLGSVVQVLPS